MSTVRTIVSDLDDAVRETKLPFDSVWSGIQWWYRPVVEARTWIALGWLFVGVVWSVIMFAIAVTVLSITASLFSVVVGFALIVPTFALCNALTSVERARAGWVGEPIDPPEFRRAEPGYLSKVTTQLSDGARWRQVLFLLLFVFIAPVLLVVGLLPWMLLVQSVFGADFEPDAFSATGLIVAALLVGGAPRITTGVAWVGRAFTAALLGPSEARELRGRVTELSGQREQILDAVAEERRRIERNLHDGVQQQLVALGIDIGRARARIDSDPEGARELLNAARDKVRGSIGELRSIGRGLHPAVLEDRGLDAALSAVVSDAPIPISVEIVTDAEIPENVASAAYYVANEAVANILKYAQARVASIKLVSDPISERAIRLTIHDDGCGGADESRGTGLAGMRARVEGLDGVFDIDSPPGGPTRLVAVLPLDGARPT